MQRINPTRLSIDSSEKLAEFLMEHENTMPQQALIPTFDPDRSFDLSHRLLRVQKYNPRLNKTEFRYYVLEQAQEIGHGSFGSVQKICGVVTLDREKRTATYKPHKANKKRVIKQCNYNASDTTKLSTYESFLKKEFSALTQAGYHHVKSIAFDTPNPKAPLAKSAYIVSAEFPSVDLNIFIQDVESGRIFLTPEKRLIISRNLIRALQEQVHERGLSHNDVKPDNIMLNEPTLEIKFIDFGLATETAHEPVRGRGTPEYAPPEIILRHDHYSIDHHFSSTKSDIFSLGLTLARLWGSTAHIYQGDRNDPNHLANKIKTTKQRHKAVAAKEDKRPELSDLFQSITPLTDHEKEQIRDTIRSMCHHRYQDRLDLAQAYTQFNDILISHRFGSNTPMSENIKLAATYGQIDHAALKSEHNLRNCVTIVTEGVNQVMDDPKHIREYVTALGVRALQDCRSRDDVKKSTYQLLDKFTYESSSLLGLLEMTETSIAIIGMSANAIESLKQELRKVSQELNYAFYKESRIQNQDMTLDSVAALTDSFRKSSAVIRGIFTGIINNHAGAPKRIQQLQSYQSIMLSLLKPAEANRADAATLRLAARLRASIKRYMDDTLTKTTIKKYDRAGSLNRQKDMKDILEIISTATSTGEMESTIEERLSQFKRVGLFGSTLKQHIQQAITDFQAEQQRPPVAARGTR